MMESVNAGEIAVVIPTHGRVDMLREAVQSVVNQTRRPNEIIVVDDLHDQATELCISDIREEICGSHVVINYVGSVPKPPAKGGASRSRNIGWQTVKCGWLAFLDDDDLWRSDFLARCKDVGEEQDSDIVVAWTELSRSGRTLGGGHSLHSSVIVSDAFRKNPGVTGSNILVRRTFLSKVGGFDEGLRVANDRDFLIRLLDEGARVSVVQERLVVQRGHDEGQLTTRSESRAKALEEFATKYWHRFSLLDKMEMHRLLHSIRRKTSASLSIRMWHTLAQIACTAPAALLPTIRSIVRGRRARVYD